MNTIFSIRRLGQELTINLGIGGAAAALALGLKGHSVKILDAAPKVKSGRAKEKKGKFTG